MPKRFIWFLSVGLLLVAIGIWHGATLQEGHTWVGDGPGYIMQAQAIAAGTPFQGTNYAPNPYRFGAPSLYPPGFPLLLAPVLAVFGVSIPALNGVMVLLLVFFAGVIAWLFKEELPGMSLPFLVAFLGFHPLLWYIKHHIHSDLLFSALLLLSLYAYEQASQEEQTCVRWTFITAFLVFAATLTKVQGLILPITFCVYSVLRSRKLSSIALVTLLAGGSAYVFYQFVYLALDPHTGSTYVELVSSTASRDHGSMGAVMWQQSIRIKNTLVSLWANGRPGLYALKMAPFYLSWPFFFWGFFRRMRTRFSSFEVFTVLYTASLLPWSFYWDRYLLPILPFYLFYVVQGVLELTKKISPRVTAALFLVAIAGSMWMFSGRYLHHYHRSVVYNMAGPFASADVQHFIAEAPALLPKEAKLMGEQPRSYALLLDRLATFPHRGRFGLPLFHDLLNLNVTHVIANERLPENLKALLTTHPSLFRLKYYTPSIKLYALHPDALPSTILPAHAPFPRHTVIPLTLSPL